MKTIRSLFLKDVGFDLQSDLKFKETKHQRFYYLSVIILFCLSPFFTNKLQAQVIFSEDFQSGIPGTWTLIDVDGLTPDANVAQFTDAWIGAEDFDIALDTVAMSNSWYNPAGASDDWLITPQISLTSGNILRWEGESQDANFLETYEVRISTGMPTIADFNANPALTTIVDESGAVRTSQMINLGLAGYANQPVYLAWRNISNDEFVLVIDNIIVEAPVAVDAELSSLDGFSEYTQVPLSQAQNIIASDGVVTNVGGSPITGVSLDVEVFDGSMASVFTSSTSGPDLAVGASSTISLSPFIPNASDIYIVEYVVNIAELDANLSNDTLFSSFIVTDSVMARDNSVATGTLGIGGELTGELGQLFTLNGPETLSSVSAFIANTTGNMTNEPLSANIYDVVNGFPSTLLTTTETITIDASQNTLWTLDIPNGGILLGVDSFAIVMVEQDSNITLGTATEIFTPGTTYVNFPGNPNGGWANNEAYNFNVSYILRANFEACLDTLNLASRITAATAQKSYQARLNITSTDTIESGALDIEYDSGGTVDLVEGFIVESGASWETLDDGCDIILPPVTARMPDKSSVKSTKSKEFTKHSFSDYQAQKEGNTSLRSKRRE